MKLLAHRGLWWNEKIQPNSLEAIQKALDLGFGVEIDVRDHFGKTVVSHDPVLPEVTITEFSEVLRISQNYDSTLAINVKTDGIAQEISTLIANMDSPSYFCFDMSIPETVKYQSLNLNCFSRVSEYEPFNNVMKGTVGIWLDSFHTDWWKDSEFIQLIQSNSTCIVSPELHGREHERAWKFVYENLDTKDLFLCTDFPLEAQRYFK